MGRLFLAGASDPWVLVASGLGGGIAWALDVPVALAAGVGVGMLGVGATANVLTGNVTLPERGQGQRQLRGGTEQQQLVTALDGYIADLEDLRSTELPPSVVDSSIEALTAARDSRSVATDMAAAIDGLEHAMERAQRVNAQWSGSDSSHGIRQSVSRMQTRRHQMLQGLSRTVGEVAEVYTKLLEVSASVSSSTLHDGSVVDIEAINASLDALREAVADLESDRRRHARGELES